VTARRSLSHARALLLVSKTIDGEVTMAELRLLAGHLRGCVACRRKARETTDLVGRLLRVRRTSRCK